MFEPDRLIQSDESCEKQKAENTIISYQNEGIASTEEPLHFI